MYQGAKRPIPESNRARGDGMNHITSDHVLEIITAREAVTRNLLKEKYVPEWQYVVIMKDGTTYAMRRIS